MGNQSGLVAVFQALHTLPQILMSVSPLSYIELPSFQTSEILDFRAS